MRNALIILVAVIFALGMAATVEAQALWQSSKPRKSLYTPRAEKLQLWKKHDLIQVEINERSNVQRLDSFESTRESELDIALERYLRIGSGLNILPGERDMGIAGDATFESTNKGARRRRSTFSETIMCEVTEVLPGYDPEENRGQLNIRGYKSSTLIDDTETLEFTGRVDVRDINPRTRTIEASRVFDARIKLTGKGDVSNAAKEGWLTKMLNTFWPF